MQKKWNKILLEIKADQKDLVPAIVSNLGSIGIDEKENIFEIYFPFQDEAGLASKITKSLQQFNIEANIIGSDVIEWEDWHLQWKDGFVPIPLTEKITIYPDWEKSHQDVDIPIFIKPGMAFGTGNHETTQMALLLLEQHLKKSKKVLDAGCGTGILTIAAIKMGAEFVDSWDIDKDIIGNFNENMELNNLKQGYVLNIGNVTSLKEYHYDLIVSNIQKEPNLKLLSTLVRNKCTAPIIFTGILVDESEEFEKRVKDYGRKIIQQLSKGEWTAFYVN